MGDLYKINPLVLIGTPTLEDRPISWEWSDSYSSLQIPLGASHTRYRVYGKRVDIARNEIAEKALEVGADWALFSCDDVIPPANIFELLVRHKKKLVTGVYWTKSYPHQPYLWRDILKGAFTDWKYGEFFKVDWSGCDALLVHTDIFRELEYPWFSTEWTFEEGQPRIPLPTEDLYFFTKCREKGIELWCDAAVQCLHQDRQSQIYYGLDPSMPQHEDYKAMLHEVPKDQIYVADIGSGAWQPHFENAVVKRFDINPEAGPDVICDVRAIPEKAETFDLVYSNHVLEHFLFWEHPDLVREWLRILRVGGEIDIRVPNLEWAAKEVLKSVDNPTTADGMYAFGAIYGTRDDVRVGEPNDNQIHKSGFTRKGLRSLFASIGCLDNIEVEADGYDGERSLKIMATKIKSLKPKAILPAWNKTDAKQPAAEIEMVNSVTFEEVADSMGEMIRSDIRLDEEIDKMFAERKNAKVRPMVAPEPSPPKLEAQTLKQRMATKDNGWQP